MTPALAGSFLTNAEENMKSTTNPAESPETGQVLLPEIEDLFTRVMAETEQYHQPRSFIYMQLVCMRAAGWTDIDYENLMAVSGYGASFAYHHNEKFWAHYLAPNGTIDRIARATGFGWEFIYFENIEDYWQALKETIDSGKPIHAAYLEEILFLGYREAEDNNDREVRPLDMGFVKRGAWWSWKEFEKWFENDSHGILGRHTGKVAVQDAREVALNVLKTIVELAYNDPRGDRPGMHDIGFGLAGLEAYINDMADTSKKENYYQSGWLGCHNIYPQWTARKFTGDYLEQAASLFPDGIGDAMRTAAKEYHAAHTAWLEWEKHLGKNTPRGAWNVKDRRTAGAAAAREALEHEKSAVAIIQQALATLEHGA